MKKALMFLVALNLMALAQKPTVAIGAIGEEPKNFKALKGLSTQLTNAIVNSGKYTAVDRSEEILKQLGKEHKTQRGGSVNEKQIKELGKQFAVQYLCIVGSSELKVGQYMLEAKLVDVETAAIASMGTIPSSLKDMEELMRVSEELAKQLLGSGASPLSQPPVKSVKIGNQTWMAENLNNNIEGSKCFGEGGKVIVGYDFDKGFNDPITKTLSDNEVQANCKKYGRLYDLLTAKKACPSGWHLPSKDEWRVLLNKVDKFSSDEGKKLKAKSGWNDYNSGYKVKLLNGEWSDDRESGSGTDDFGFSALPGGRGNSDGSFLYVGEYGYWWSTDDDNDEWDMYRDRKDNAYFLEMSNKGNGANLYYYGEKYKDLFSVRCVQY